MPKTIFESALTALEDPAIRSPEAKLEFALDRSDATLSSTSLNLKRCSSGKGL